MCGKEYKRIESAIQPELTLGHVIHRWGGQYRVCLCVKIFESKGHRGRRKGHNSRGHFITDRLMRGEGLLEWKFSYELALCLMCGEVKELKLIECVCVCCIESQFVSGCWIRGQKARMDNQVCSIVSVSSTSSAGKPNPSAVIGWSKVFFHVVFSWSLRDSSVSGTASFRSGSWSGLLVMDTRFTFRFSSNRTKLLLAEGNTFVVFVQFDPLRCWFRWFGFCLRERKKHKIHINRGKNKPISTSLHSKTNLHAWAFQVLYLDWVHHVASIHNRCVAFFDTNCTVVT